MNGPAPDWDRIEDPQLREWLRGQPIEFRHHHRDWHIDHLRRLKFDGEVAEAIGEAGPGLTPEEKAMTSSEFVAHLNRMIADRKAAEQVGDT